MHKKRSPYETILVLAGAGIVLYILFSYKWILCVSLVLIIVSVLFPALAAFIDKAWFRIAELIGFVVGKVLFSIVYIFLLLPLSVLFKKRLSIDLKRKDSSLFRERNHLYVKKDLENIW